MRIVKISFKNTLNIILVFVIIDISVVVIVPLLFPTLYHKRGIFNLSPLLWVFETLSKVLEKGVSASFSFKPTAP